MEGFVAECCYIGERVDDLAIPYLFGCKSRHFKEFRSLFTEKTYGVQIRLYTPKGNRKSISSRRNTTHV